MMPARASIISIHSPSPLNLWLGGLLAVTLAAAAIAQPQPATANYYFSHLAGSLGGPGHADGNGAAARFYFPFAVAIDNAGNLYVADSGNHTIRKVTPARFVTTLAAGKSTHKLPQALAKIYGQTENRAQLDDDGVHLPVPVAQVQPEQRLRYSQMRGGADGKEFCEAFNDAEQSGEEVVVQ